MKREVIRIIHPFHFEIRFEKKTFYQMILIDNRIYLSYFSSKLTFVVFLGSMNEPPVTEIRAPIRGYFKN